MTPIIPDHRTAAPEELADHDARMERTKSWDPAKVAAELTVAAADLVRMANCPQCWQRPGKPCTITAPAGDHLARWQRAERRGLISRGDLAAVVAGLEVIAAHVIIRDGAQ